MRMPKNSAVSAWQVMTGPMWMIPGDDICWLVVTGCHEFYFPKLLGCDHHPNWRTHIFQRGGYTTTNQFVILAKEQWNYPKIPTVSIQCLGNFGHPVDPNIRVARDKTLWYLVCLVSVYHLKEAHGMWTELGTGLRILENNGEARVWPCLAHNCGIWNILKLAISTQPKWGKSTGSSWVLNFLVNEVKAMGFL